MIIVEDVNNKPNQHILKNEYWQQQNIEVKRYRLPIADYIIANDKVLDVIERKTKRGIEPKMMDFLGTYTVAVDTKKDMLELILPRSSTPADKEPPTTEK